MEQKYINYIGPSMNPLLRNGDGLHIVAYNGRAVRPGDVIVFVPPGGETKIVHRVVSIDACGVKTRGDNGKQVDPWVLTADNILGRVTYIQRRNRRRNICGGFKGRVMACSFRCMHRGDAVISFLLHPVYQRLCRSTFLRNRLHLLVKPRVLSFRRPEGMEQQLVVGHRLIGRRRPGKGYWEIRRPFRLCVDESLLPDYLPNELASEGCKCTPACGERPCSVRNSIESEGYR
jgi:hypothetical protein